MKLFIKDFFSKCDQIRSFLMQNLIFCAVRWLLAKHQLFSLRHLLFHVVKSDKFSLLFCPFLVQAVLHEQRNKRRI